MLIQGFPAPLFGTNCFVVAPGAGEQCVIVDPGGGVREQLDDVIEQHNLHPVAVVLTHGHLDHTFSVLPVCDARDIPAFIHTKDRSSLADPWTFHGQPRDVPLWGLPNLTVGEPSDVRELSDNMTLDLAGMTFTVRHAPGHTEGSVVFGMDLPDLSVLFAGDVLFEGSIGRTDLPGGSMAQMNQTLRDVILPMDDDVVVLPGHGDQTTIGRERLTNPYLRGL